MMKFLTGTLLSFSLGMPLANAQVWVDGKGQSCDVACAAAGVAAVVTGQYYKLGNHPFYLCAANANKEGYRAGYNLQPRWANACVVGYGGDESFQPTYKCLCAGGFPQP